MLSVQSITREYKLLPSAPPLLPLTVHLADIMLS